MFVKHMCLTMRQAEIFIPFSCEAPLFIGKTFMHAGTEWLNLNKISWEYSFKTMNQSSKPVLSLGRLYFSQNNLFSLIKTFIYITYDSLMFHE